MRRLLIFFLFLPSLALAPSPIIPLTKADNFLFGLKYQLYLNPEPEFTPQLLYDYLVYLKVTDIDIVFRQAILETNHFQSKVFLTNHNLFGMKRPIKRPTTSLHTQGTYASYTHWMQSVLDYLMLLRYRPTLTNCFYTHLMAIGYAEDEAYITKLKNINIKTYVY